MSALIPPTPAPLTAPRRLACGWIPLAMLLALLLNARSAHAVAITAGSGSGLAGQTVEIAVNTASLTGLGVYSYQFSMSYNPAVVTPISVNTTGTLSASPGWNAPAFNPGSESGVLSVSAAGSQTLSGAGPLVKIQFAINPAQLSASASGLYFQSFLFNEGTPAATTTDGYLTVNATPSIAVSPNSGEIVRGDSLQFTASGSVTLPLAWYSSDTSLATISAAGWLKGKKPGAVRVFAVDNAGIRDTTNGDILIRGMTVTVGNAVVVQGQPVSVPVTTTRLTGLGIRAGQFTVTYNATLLTPTGMTTPDGTLLRLYGPTAFGAGDGTLTVDFTGNSDLSGSGTLCFLEFATVPSVSGGTSLTLGTVLFNESLPAKRTDGYVTVNALASITVSPDNVTLLAGQTQAFTVSGGPSPPITWSTLNPAVASINSSGLLRAVAGGVTKVHAVDNVGAADDNNSVTVYDFQLNLPTVTALPGSTVLVPLTLDRLISTYSGNIYSAQYTLVWNPAYISGANSLMSGLIAQWGTPFINVQSDRVSVAAAGSQPLTDNGPRLHALEITIAAAAPSGVDVPLAPTVLINEGAPSVLVSPGVIHVRNTTDVRPAPGVLALGPLEPNPMRRSMRIEFSLPGGAGAVARARLAIFGLDGRRVKLLVDGPLDPGPHQASWDGRGESGDAAAPGVYFCRLEWQGLHLERKLAMLR